MAKTSPNLNKDDVLNALVSDPLADAIRRALEMGYTGDEVRDAADRGVLNGEAEFAEGVH